MFSEYPSGDSFYIPARISRGQVPGKNDYRRLGRVPAVNNVTTDICSFLSAGSVYVPPASPIQMRVVSTSANDTAAGTGVRTVEINYLDTNYIQQTEIVTLNGTTPVNTVANNIYRVNDFHTKTVGSGEFAAGNISIQNTAGTVTYRQIDAGFNTDLTGFFTVPANKYYILTSWNFASGQSSGTHFTQGYLKTTSTHDGVLTLGIFHTHDITATENGALDVEFNIPIAVPPTADIKLSALSDSGAANVICTGHFGGWLEDA